MLLGVIKDHYYVEQCNTTEAAGAGNEIHPLLLELQEDFRSAKISYLD